MNISIMLVGVRVWMLLSIIGLRLVVKLLIRVKVIGIRISVISVDRCLVMIRNMKVVIMVKVSRVSMGLFWGRWWMGVWCVVSRWWVGGVVWMECGCRCVWNGVW